MSRTARAKIRPPPLPATFVPRPLLLQRLGEARGRRLTTVVADAGFGKTTTLAAWAHEADAAWYTLDHRDVALVTFLTGLVDAIRCCLPTFPEEVAGVFGGMLGPDHDEHERAAGFAAQLAAALDERLDRHLVLLLDDVQELPPDGAATRLLRDLSTHAPTTLHLVLASRRDPPFAVERLRGQGLVLDLDASTLVLSPAETEALLVAVLGEEGAELTPSVQRVTGGWPAAARLAAETLRDLPHPERRTSLARMHRAGGRLFSFLAAEVFAREPSDVRALLRSVAPLPGFTAELCAALGFTEAPGTLAALVRQGLVLEPGNGLEGWYRLHDLVRESVVELMPLTPGELADLQSRAAEWFAQHQHFDEAAESLAAVADLDRVAAFLTEHAPAMLAAGATQALMRVAALLGEDRWDAAVDEHVGIARLVRGDWDGALTCFRRAAAGQEVLPAAVAWRMGMIHHLRGELGEALATYDRAGPEGEDWELSLLRSMRAGALWLHGDAAACRAEADSALVLARSSGNLHALASAYTTMAMVAALEGDRRENDAMYRKALDAAEQGGSVLQIVRIRANRGSHLVEEGDYAGAVEELDSAVRLGELSGFATFLALALHNRGEARRHLGRLEEAVVDYEAAQAVYQRISSSQVSYPLTGLGDVHCVRGELALARAAYEEALGVAEAAGDVQGLVPALAGLARVLAAEDLDAAARMAGRAVAVGPGIGQVQALLAAGWVARARDELERAGGLADDAAGIARQRRDQEGLAEALELAAACDHSERAVALLDEAIAIWRRLGAAVGAARAELARHRRGSGPESVAGAEAAGHRLRELGVRARASSPAGALAWAETVHPPPLAVHALGGFQVLRDGRPIPSDGWQSRKARNLLKQLVARRGRPLPRERLIDALWPGEDPGRVGNRLSVTLSTLRAVLDPEHRFPAEQYVAGDREALSVDLANIDVDVEAFLDQAAAGLALQRSGRASEAHPLLVTAEGAYGGDFLEGDPYEDWAVALREEARATYLAVTGALATHAAAAGDPDLEMRYRLRLLERDPYDEPTYLQLVTTLLAAGRRGEAHRHYRRYEAQMAEIGVEAAPFPVTPGR